MSSPPGKIAVVQVSSGASCNASLPSTKRRNALRGPTPRNRWPDFSPEIQGSAAGGLKNFPAPTVQSDFNACHTKTKPGSVLICPVYAQFAHRIRNTGGRDLLGWTPHAPGL